MKVKDLEYKRVTAEEFKEISEKVINQIKNAKSCDEILKAREEYLNILLDYTTAASLSYMRFTINTADEFYLKEKDYYDEASPIMENCMIDYQKALLNSPFRAELEQELSPILFKSMETDIKSISPDIIDELVEENKLTSEYSKLMSEIEFEFHGEKMPRPMLMKYAKSKDRQTRIECYEVLGKTLNEYSEQLDRIFDDLVHIRDKMAKKMGYKDFVELGYYRMSRLCYDRNDVEKFRENVLKDLVPAVSKVRLDNAKKLGISDYALYDDGVVIADGDPTPVSKDELFEAAKYMYHKMSPESAAFIDMMLENEAFDVDSRKNKWGGGYCTEFEKYKQPFILANFNGTSSDVDVVTHEAGHALNAYLIADNKFALELSCGGMETAETHSMSMEFFAWPYMNRFFGDNADKYCYAHAMDAFSFIPYGTMVDYFQHIVYENPDMTPKERNEIWKKLESQFRPHIKMDGIPFIEDGRRWQYQMHIYESPFYYIDYCLAQTAAFQFLLASRENYEDAFNKYLRFSKQGGEKLWTDLLHEAGFRTPFEPGALKTLSSKIEELLSELGQKI